MSIGTNRLHEIVRMLVIGALLAVGGWALNGCGSDGEVGWVDPPPDPTATSLPTVTPVNSYTPTITETPTVTQTGTRTATPTRTSTATARATGTITRTPRDTATATNTPTPTKTPTITLTPTETRTPRETPEPGAVVVTVEDVVGVEGTRIEVPVTLVTAGREVASVQHDLLFDDTFLELLAPAVDCVINEDIGVGQPGCTNEPHQGPCKILQRNLGSCPGVQGCPEGFIGKRLRANIQSSFNSNPIPDGALYSCSFVVPAGRTGATWVDSRQIVAAAPNGEELLGAGVDGYVLIVPPPTPTPHPCCRDWTGTGNTGCEISECETCVCSEDSVCCTHLWDGTCVEIAKNECASDCPCGP